MTAQTPPPSVRRLRGYAVDPSLSLAVSTQQVNDLTYRVNWEQLDRREDESGQSYPGGEYVEIVDFDPASGRFYEPVDLDDPHLLAQDGHAPSVSNPQFHQQMVYAVIMTTIKNFEQALGRKILWAENIPAPQTHHQGTTRKAVDFGFVQRLRVYPHALRQANAFYDPNRKSLLFGYFDATPAAQLPESRTALPPAGATVFTCLSHDIVAHETTHAILDGLHRRYIESTHPDTSAFHEAFADIVALFQHFTFPEVLKHQIAATQGDLKRQNMLGQLAQEFGRATGSYGSLRDAIGEVDEQSGQWKPRTPNPADYATQMEPHDRGAILVAAVFAAFLAIYQTRVTKLLRIATGGTGILPQGDLHPDLIDEMAQTAANVARDVLRICIRALDYCPPLDLTYGDYLRALLTADYDMVAEDVRAYRVAFVEAFQKRGIRAPVVKSMAVEELLYPLSPGPLRVPSQTQIGTFLRELKNSVGYLTDRQEIYNETKKFIKGHAGLHHLIQTCFATGEDLAAFRQLSGLMFPPDRQTSEALGLEWGHLSSNMASYAVSNVWLANRVTPDDTIVNHVIITLAQKRGVRFQVDDGGQTVTVDKKGYFVPDNTPHDKWGDHHIIFRGGCTLIFDLDTLKLRYAIKKDIDDQERMVRQYRFENGLLGGADATYFNKRSLTAVAGPFAFMHSHSAQQ
ncbi:MAG: hypothetical protein JSS02_21460 [Planctomycetes bacterium]|nr:hypothetical protein [Planctomycetota bacterium]